MSSVVFALSAASKQEQESFHISKNSHKAINIHKLHLKFLPCSFCSIIKLELSMTWSLIVVSTFWLWAMTDYTLGSHSGVSVCLVSGQDSCSEEPGRLAVPQLRKWRAGSAARHCRRFVAGYPRREGEFAYQIPRFNQNNVLSFTSCYVANMSCTSFYEQKLLNFKNCTDHHLAPCWGLILGRSFKPSNYRCAIQCISPL